MITPGSNQNVMNLEKMAEIFKILSDSSRLKIVVTLLNCERCVTDLVTITELSQSSVSHHLQTLRLTDIVRFRKQGQRALYSLADQHIQVLLEIANEHVSES